MLKYVKKNINVRKFLTQIFKLRHRITFNYGTVTSSSDFSLIIYADVLFLTSITLIDAKNR